MKKTERNQNMTNQRLRKDDASRGKPGASSRQEGGYKERYKNSNLDKSNSRGGGQRYDDYTGTVENGIG